MSNNITYSEKDKIRIFNNQCILTITGLPALLCHTNTLSSAQWFGKFGDIKKICIVKSERNPDIVYIKYTDARCAAKAIETMNRYHVPHTNNVLHVYCNANHDESISQLKPEFTPLENMLCGMYLQPQRVINDKKTKARKRYAEGAEYDFNRADRNDRKLVKRLQAENDGIRDEHSALIENYHLLLQEYNNMCDYKEECRQLKKRCRWLQKQLQTSMDSNLELRQLVFQDIDASTTIAAPMEQQVEGVMDN